MNNFARRKNRRRTILSITRTLEEILKMEMKYYQSIEDIQINEDRLIESGYTLDMIDEAICLLKSTY